MEGLARGHTAEKHGAGISCSRMEGSAPRLKLGDSPGLSTPGAPGLGVEQLRPSGGEEAAALPVQGLGLGTLVPVGAFLCRPFVLGPWSKTGVTGHPLASGPV